MAADFASSGTDTGNISETSEISTADAADVYDIDPDAANYADGNDPDIAYRNQGRADSPNGWGSRPGTDSYPDNDNEHDESDYADGASEQDQSRYGYDAPDLWGDTDPDAANYADLGAHGIRSSDQQDGPDENDAAADRGTASDISQPDQEDAAASSEHDRPHEYGSDSDKLDLWGDTDPDAANYADLDDRGTDSRGGRHDDVREDKLEASPDAGQPGQEQHAEENAERTESPEQQQIMALKAELTSARQQIADLKAEREAAKNEQAARPGRIEPLPADSDTYQDREKSTLAEGADTPGASPAQDASRAERRRTEPQTGRIEAEDTRWRRVASAENVGAISTLLGAADLAMHGMPGLAVALGATAIGVASWGQAKIEKHRKGKP